MRVLIAEDDVLIGENLSMIVKSKGYSVSKIIQTMSEFNQELELGSFDMALLDIRMNGKDLGCDMANQLKETGIPFVFVTSFSDKNTLKNAVSSQPFGYILKPFDKTEIITVLENVERTLESKSIVLKVGNVSTKIFINEIMYCFSENVYVTVYTLEDRFVVRSKIVEISKMISSNLFIRTHQSYVVNFKYVKNLTENELIMNDNFVVPVSRKYQKEVKDLFNSIT